MPLASPALRRLRIRTGIKSGPWAERVQVNGNHYVNVEGRHKPGSNELFARCAAALTELLGERIDPVELIANDEAGHASAGGPTSEATETTQAAEAEASVRGVA